MARATSKTKKKTVTEKKHCPKCTRDLALSNFYAASDVLYPDQKFHLCKSCIEQIIDEQGFSGFMMILRAMNKPFISDIFTGDYKSLIRMVNSLPQYRGMTYDDSTDMGTNTKIINKNNNKDEENENIFEITNEAKKRWVGFKDEDMVQLEDFYQELVMNYEHGTPIQRNLYKNMAITQFKANIAIAEGKNKEYKDLMDTLSKLMNDANIKPVQETGAEANGISSFGEFIKMIEETEPIPEPRDEFKDVDGIKKYIDKWFVHQFARVFGLTNESMDEYDNKLAIQDGEANG